MHLCYNKKYKSIYQRMGLTTQMVHQICEDAAIEGFDYVEAYANADFVGTVEDFRGPIGMHEKCGFLKIGELNGKAVMRKKLK